jgi:hypothetical protein
MSKSDWSGLAARESQPIDNVQEATARARDLRTKNTPERMQAVIDNIRDGQPITRAARLAGLNPATVHRWREEDEEFKEAVEDALEFQIAALTAKVDRASDTDWKAAAWRLERLRPDEFGAKKELQVTATQSNGIAEVIAMIEQTNDSVKPEVDE